MAGRLRVRTDKGQNPVVREKERLGKGRSRLDNAGKLDKLDILAIDQTGITGINTQGIMGKRGETWRGVETIPKTVETDQVVTDL
jgi:hypothetical protein